MSGLNKVLPRWAVMLIFCVIAIVILGFLKIEHGPGGCSVTRKEHWALRGTIVQAPVGAWVR